MILNSHWNIGDAIVCLCDEYFTKGKQYNIIKFHTSKTIIVYDNIGIRCVVSKNDFKENIN